jgi:hypothetical protein
MGELGTRWIVAGLVVCVVGWLGIPSFAFAATVAIVWAIVTSGLLRLNRENPGIAGFIAAADAFAMALLFSGAARLGSLGWLAGLPAVYAIVRYGCRPQNVLALSSGLVLTAHLAVQTKLPSAMLCAQLGGLIVLGFLLRKPLQSERPDVIGPIDPLGAQDPETMLGLRESFRQLKVLYKNLQWKSRRDRIVAGLLETKYGDSSSLVSRLAEQVTALTGAKKTTIYAVCREPRGFAAPEGFLRIDPNEAVGRIRHQADQLNLQQGTPTINVPLVSEAGVVGLCSLQTDAALTDDIRLAAEELAPTLAALLSDTEKKTSDQHRNLVNDLRLGSLLRTRGATQSTDIAERTANSLLELLNLQHVSLYRAGELLASAGTTAPPIEWFLGDDLVAPDASTLSALPSSEITRMRIGGLMSLRVGQIQLVATGRIGTVTADVADLVRSVCADLDWLLDGAKPEGGLLSADLFRARMSDPGVLVLLEQVDRDTRSQNDVDHTTRSLTSRVLNFLPSRGGVLVRADGDILIHLPGAKLAEASNWAHRVAQGHAAARVRTASLWPRTSAAVSVEHLEPEALFTQSH